MADWIPRADADYLNFVQNMDTVVTASPTTFGLTSGQATDLDTAFLAWKGAYVTTQGTQALLHSQVIAQDGLRTALDAILRADNAIVQATPTVKPEEKALAGFPVRDTTPTPVPPPATEPIIYLSNGGHTKILVVLHDTGSPDAHSHAKPDGVTGIDLWVQKNGTPPVDNSTMMSLGPFTKTRFTLTFDPADVGKTLYFLGRWVNPTGQKGAWSVVASGVLS